MLEYNKQHRAVSTLCQQKTSSTAADPGRRARRRTWTDGAAVLLLSAGLAAMLLCLWLAPGRWNHLPAQALPPWEAEQELAEAQRLNINRATAAELETLPGIGPELAGRIIAYREQYGDFLSVDELTAVHGIGEKKLAAIRAYITAG